MGGCAVFKKILIANRGEIALRIIRAARELGIETVAVYSEADRESTHVRFADDDVCIGPAPARDSYLKIPRLIAAAEEDGSSCDFKEIRDLKKEMLEQIEHFFVSYNQVEGKKFTPLRRSGPATARRLVQNAQVTFQREQHTTPRPAPPEK